MTKNSESTMVVYDGCAVNAETAPARFPVEPLNTFSNFGFLFIIVYWVWKTKFRIRLYPVIVITMPLLFGAFIAGTMHHALRNDKVWHHIDMLCIFYAVITTCVYFWYRVTGSWIKSFLCVIAIPFIFRAFLASISLPEKIAISVVFVIMGLIILIPATIHCIKNQLKNLDMLIISSLSFLIALTFRQADANLVGIFPYGTHFLWHIFGMISVFYLIKYIFLTDKTKNLNFFKEIASRCS
jgi:hypothetical protein